jgi:cellulose synthase/poly-beta-1,6-N-acetylglucosamine synthase-like glycosyltransferase
MSNLRLRQQNPKSARAFFDRDTHLPLGRHLVNAGLISPTDLIFALNMQLRMDAPLGEIFVAEGLIDEATLHDVLALQHDVEQVDLGLDPPDARLRHLLSAEYCLHHRVVPWMQIGDVIFVATSRPDQIADIRAVLARKLCSVVPVLASTDSILTSLSALHGAELAQRAENRVDPAHSCRNWGKRTVAHRVWFYGAAMLGLTAVVLFPIWVFLGLVLLAIGALVLATGMKSAAFLAQVMSKVPVTQVSSDEPPRTTKLPTVSVMVPLLHEKEIAHALITRLSRLTYPKALLDVVLVLEERDTVTRQTLAQTRLPSWMKVVEVPYTGGVTTKPRALNYALDFCRGSIIGVWDAEDQPQANQIETVVRHFDSAAPEVVCLQGVLDYYNPRANWMARCFTIEYATWWRIIMPGIAKLGLVIPLGGTTLFFRRDALEVVQAWDAHNVTEDADLGFRLAQYGYRTEMIPTVTHEEATCRPWPWIRQRSRWLKGFMVTYLVHMRRPADLFKTLGLRKFLGFQVFFLAAIAPFLLAPVLWSFWLILFGLPHPLQQIASDGALLGLASLFALSETIGIIVGMVAVSGKDHRHLMPWVPTLALYFPLGALACYKALYELVVDPFFWDKTQHGHSIETPAD